MKERKEPSYVRKVVSGLRSSLKTSAGDAKSNARAHDWRNFMMSGFVPLASEASTQPSPVGQPCPKTSRQSCLPFLHRMEYHTVRWLNCNSENTDRLPSGINAWLTVWAVEDPSDLSCGRSLLVSLSEEFKPDELAVSLAFFTSIFYYKTFQIR